MTLDDLNRLEVEIAESQTGAESAKWLQAETVSTLVDAGTSLRKIGAAWFKSDGTTPYGKDHVRIVAEVFRRFGDAEDRPKFSTAYSAVKGPGKTPEETARSAVKRLPNAVEPLFADGALDLATPELLDFRQDLAAAAKTLQKLIDRTAALLPRESEPAPAEPAPATAEPVVTVLPPSGETAKALARAKRDRAKKAS